MTSLSDQAIRRAHYKLQLQGIIAEAPGTLIAAVATEALDHDDPATFLSDVLAHGCVSGVVGTLVYYRQTHAFYDQYYDEIEDLRLDWVAETGQPVEISGDLKNYLAWFAFEHFALVLSETIGLDT